MDSHDVDCTTPGKGPPGTFETGRLGAPDTFDVFISYSSADRDTVRRVVRRLRRLNVEPWFDRWSLTPGGAWQDEVTAGLLASSACAVFVGPGDLGPWERLELSVALNKAAVDPSFRLIPVLLPGVESFEPARLPPLLATRTWVDLRDGPDSDHALQQLVNAVHGVPFGADVAAGPVDDPAPYRGLAVFEEQDARLFFGREGAVQRLTEKLRGSRFVAVVGPSGCGKSSLVRAGLLPRLRASARIVVLRPGAHPLAALAGRLLHLDPDMSLQPTVDRLADDERTLHLAASAALADEPPDARVLVVVDQCEELFTLCPDPAERRSFLGVLHYASMVPGGRTAVAVTLRSDFYSRLAELPDAAQLVQDHQLLVGAMTDNELRQAIEEPARVVGLEIERGLTDTILDDVVREPGALPLLEHALLETWRRRRGGMLTLEGYRAAGGVQKGLADRAEAIFAELPPQGQGIAQHLFLRLTQPGEGTEDTRRQAGMAEMATGADENAVEDVVHRFVAERLLTTGADETTGESWVEVAHEALIRGWPRLQGWIDADRAGLLVHRRLTVAAQEWQRHGGDRDALYRGARLAEALALQRRQADRLNAIETEFLRAGEKAEHRSRAARRRRRNVAIAALTAAVTAISLVALVAVGQGREAARQRDVAVSRQLAAGAADALAVDPSLGLALALRAVDTARTDQAEEVLRRATAEARGRQVLHTDAGPVRSVRMLPGQQRVAAVADDGRLRVWDLEDEKPVIDVPVHDGRARVMRPTPDGQRVVSIGEDRTVAVTDLATGVSRVLDRGPEGRLPRALDISPDGRTVAVIADDGAVRLLDAGTGTEAWAVDLGDTPLESVAFSPDGRLVAVSADDGSVELLATADGARVRTLQVGAGAVYDVDFSPTGTQILTAGTDGTARLWNVATARQEASFAVAKEALFTATFSPTGDRFVTTGYDGAVRVWDTDGVELVVLHGHVGYSFDARFDEHGETVISAGEDGTVRTWDIGPYGAAVAPVVDAALSPDGQRIVAGGTDGHVRVWRADDLQLLLDLPGHVGRIGAGFSGDGRRIFSYGEDGVVRIRAADDGRELAQLRPSTGQIWAAALDATGDRLATGGEDANVVITSLTGEPPRVLAGHAGAVYSVAFAPDGRSVASASKDGTVRLWGPDGQAKIFSGHVADVLGVTFSRDGQRLASVGDDGTVRVWSAYGGQVALLRGHEGKATCVRFSPDGKQVVTAGQDGTVRIWDVASSRLLMTLVLYSTPVTGLDVGPDGRTIVTSSEPAQVLRTSSCEVCGPLDQVIAAARTRPARTLTPEEEQRWIP